MPAPKKRGGVGGWEGAMARGEAGGVCPRTNGNARDNETTFEAERRGETGVGVSTITPCPL